MKHNIFNKRMSLALASMLVASGLASAQEMAKFWQPHQVNNMAVGILGICGMTSYKAVYNTLRQQSLPR